MANTTYYCDPSVGPGSSTAPYDTWAKAATDLQTIIDIPIAPGDIIYCRGTQTLGAATPLNSTSAGSGDTTDGKIKFIGCHADGTANGAQFTIDANSASAQCLNMSTTRNHWQFENFTFKNSTGDLIDGGAYSADDFRFIQCLFDNAGADGIGNRVTRYTHFIQCAFTNCVNGLDDTGIDNHFLFCRFNNNSGNGIDARYANIFFGCVFYENTGNGIDAIDGIVPRTIVHCVFDRKTVQVDGYEGLAADENTVLIGNRFSHNSGFAIVGGPCIHEDWNVFHSNTERSGVDAGPNSITDDVNDGYTSATDHDYNITADADIDNEPIDLNWA